MTWWGEHRAFIVEEFIKNGGSPVVSGGRRVSQIWPPANFFSGATSKQRFMNNVSKLWKLWRRRYERKLLPLHLKWFSRSWTTTERGYISLSIFKAATWVMFCSKHVDVKRHSVYFPEIKKNICRIFFGFEFISFPNRGVLSAAPCRYTFIWTYFSQWFDSVTSQIIDISFWITLCKAIKLCRRKVGIVISTRNCLCRV